MHYTEDAIPSRDFKKNYEPNKRLDGNKLCNNQKNGEGLIIPILLLSAGV